MKPALVLTVVALALGCYTDTNPLDAWAGTWQLMSVDSLTLPATYLVGGNPAQIVYRTLYVYAGGQGLWMDSSQGVYQGCLGGISAADTICNTSGRAVVSWTAVADTLTVTRLLGTTLGYVIPVKTFVRQVDGSLVKTDEQQYEVYRR